MRIIAIDPGEKVGWATACSTDSGLELLEHGITSLKPFALALINKLHTYDLVIFERWVLFSGQAKRSVGSSMPTSQLVGMIKLACWYKDVPFVEQTPKIKGTADKVAKDEFKRLIEAEPASHDDGHDIDAIRHLVYWDWDQQKEANRAK